MPAGRDRSRPSHVVDRWAERGWGIPTHRAGCSGGVGVVAPGGMRVSPRTCMRECDRGMYRHDRNGPVVSPRRTDGGTSISVPGTATSPRCTTRRPRAESSGTSRSRSGSRPSGSGTCRRSSCTRRGRVSRHERVRSPAAPSVVWHSACVAPVVTSVCSRAAGASPGAPRTSAARSGPSVMRRSVCTCSAATVTCQWSCARTKSGDGSGSGLPAGRQAVMPDSMTRSRSDSVRFISALVGFETDESTCSCSIAVPGRAVYPGKCDGRMRPYGVYY